jgi:hypothetical protein
LPGDAGVAEPVGGVALPDVEGAVGCRGQVDRGSMLFRTFWNRSVCAEASARAGGLARNEGELESMRLTTFCWRELSVHQDSSMAVNATTR